MVPIHPLGLLALSTLYNPQEIPHSWTTSQVIPHTWESLSDTSLLNNPLSDTPHLKIPKWYLTLRLFFSKIYKWFHKILVQNFRLKWYKKTRIEWCTNDMQVLEQWCTKKILSQGSNIFKKGLRRLSSWNNEDLESFYRGKRLNGPLGVQPVD